MPKPKITESDLCRAAKRLRCSTAEVETVGEVESRGEPFYADGFPVILFERHKFHSFTKGVFDQSHPHLSNKKAGGYGKAGQNQQNKFNEAFALSPTAAMKSCSWGRFQIMGFNYGMCGFESVGAFVDAMKESEGKQLDAFVGFVITAGLADELREHDWAGFARGYNGASYKKNQYDTKLAKAWDKFKKRKIHCNGSAPVSQTTALTTAENSEAQSSTSDQQAPSNGTVKVEITPEGGVKASTTEGSDPAAPKERIAVVKTAPQKWYAGIGAKITGVVTGNSVFQWAWARIEQFQEWSVPMWVWFTISGLVVGGSLIWILTEIMENRQENRRQKELDELLVKENSTNENLVQLIPFDEAEIYRAKKFKIITRGEKI